MKYFFDTYAIFEIINQNPSYEPFAEEEIVTSVLNLGELYYGLLRDQNKKIAKQWIKKLLPVSLAVDFEIIQKGMDFKFANKKKNFSFIDCVGYELARKTGLKFVTGDKEFEGLPFVVFLK